MKFRIVSDLHQEFLIETYYLPKMDDDKDTVLILAGDIGNLAYKNTYEDFIEKSSKQFKSIFWIAGNHEYYHANISKHSISKIISNFNNIHTNVLEFPDEKKVIIGETLWTDFDKRDPISMNYARSSMNDFYLIREGSSKIFSPESAFNLHIVEKNRIFNQVKKYENWTVIVVTHHHPSFQGVSKEYEGSVLNGAFYSNLEEEIKELNINYWICGHTHSYREYSIGNTKVICNPKGYQFERNTNFNPNLILDL